jgi:pSer/pThr/pTyr-binding forkhead associated (FHA) protein
MMIRYRTAFLVVILGVALLLPTAAMAQQAWIVDILANPSRNWNRTVTLVGQVQNVVANPVGTTRGTYTLLDESCPTPLTVRTNDLPPVGKTSSAAPILKEVSRSSPGMSATMLYVLIGAGVLFLGLLIVFIVLLTRKPTVAAPAAETIRPRPQETIRPTARPMAPPPAPAPPLVAADPSRTAKISPAPSADKTQVFMSLGADLVCEKGPDKGREFSLHKQVTTLGRAGARSNDVEVTDDTVSKDQASIYYDGTRLTFSIANESGTNPTKVNGQQISGPTQLENGSVIEMGRTVLRFKKN